MPELPEVEVLVRKLNPLLQGRCVCRLQVRRSKVLAGTPASQLKRKLAGARFTGLSRRGKYLVFTLRARGSPQPLKLLGHLGMTGRMYLLPAREPLPRHAAVVLDLGRDLFVFEDTRYFGRFTLDLRPLERLGPEPLSADFRLDEFQRALKRSRQAIKPKLLDQRLVVGLGNIYASEALFRAGVSPTLMARRLTAAQARRLWLAIRAVLRHAISWGSTVPLNYLGQGKHDKLFYFGRAPDAPDFYTERLRVYDRAGRPCRNCGSLIRRLVQAGRSTYWCPRCQSPRQT